jgi:hypothetical protein
MAFNEVSEGHKTRPNSPYPKKINTFTKKRVKNHQNCKKRHQKSFLMAFF